MIIINKFILKFFCYDEDKFEDKKLEDSNEGERYREGQSKDWRAIKELEPIKVGRRVIKRKKHNQSS